LALARSRSRERPAKKAIDLHQQIPIDDSAVEKENLQELSQPILPSTKGIRVTFQNESLSKL